MQRSADQPRAPQGTPEGGQWVDDGHDGRRIATPRAARPIKLPLDVVDHVVNEILVADVSVGAIARHAINQIIDRGVSPEAILDALRDPSKIRRKANFTTQYIGAGAGVVLNDYGGMVAVWSKQ